MAKQTIDGTDVLAWVREVGDEEWKQLACELDNTEDYTNDVTEVESKCGIHVAVKPPKANVSGNAVYNADSDFVNIDDVRNWQRNRTALELKIQNAAFTAEDGTSFAEGQYIHHLYTGKFVKTSGSHGVGDVGKFNWEFKPTSDPDDSGAS